MADDRTTKQLGGATGKGFMPGVSGNPKGRPKGARCKLGEAFLEAMHDDFVSNGVKAIERVRMERPAQYLKVIASILPKEMNIKVDPIEEYTDDQLRELATQLSDALGIDEGICAGAARATEKKTLQ